MNLIPRLGEHAAIVGTNGSGKTTTAIQLLKPLAKAHQVIIVDSKLDEQLEHVTNLVIEEPRDAVDFLLGKERRSFIYRPEGFFNQPEQLDWFLQTIYDAKRSLIVYVDEARRASLTQTRAGNGYSNLLTRGRSRTIRGTNRKVHVSVISSTQRPVWVPKDIFTESTRFFIHGVKKDDLKRMSEYVGDDEILQNPPIYGAYDFWYYDLKRHHKKKIRFKLGDV